MQVLSADWDAVLPGQIYPVRYAAGQPVPAALQPLAASLGLLTDVPDAEADAPVVSPRRARKAHVGAPEQK